MEVNGRKIRFRFPKRRRILSSSDFSVVMKKGRFAADDVLVVNALTSKVSTTESISCFSGRLGVTIPKKAGPAVVRNKWKRLIREAYRLEQHQLPLGFDFVVKPKRGAKPEFHAIRKSLRRLVARVTKTTIGKRGGK